MLLQQIFGREADMFDPQYIVRSHFLQMPPYEPILPYEVLSQQLGLPVSQIIKLDANENPYGPIPAVQEALAALLYAHIYPDPESRQLRAALSAYHKLPVENILVGAGADELIDLTMRLMLDPGDAILNCPPTFGMYAFDGDLNGAQTISIPRKADFSLDIQAIEEAVLTCKPKLLFLAHPNNPDGGPVPPNVIDRLLELPVLLVLDEAYVEFSSADTSMIQQVTNRTNLIVLRTFSKWAGLAGLRIGYGVFPSGLIQHLWKIKQPYNVSVAASSAALASLDHAEELERTGRMLVNERQRLYERLQNISWLKTYPSQANFILCRVIGRDAALVKAQLAMQGILVRYFRKPGLEDHLRISVGKPEHTDAIIAAFAHLE